jgi:hypothetical protein
MKTYRLIAVFMLILMMALPATAAGAQGVRSASVSLTAPLPASPNVGNEISFDLVVSTTDITPGVAGVDVYVKYNPALVTPPPSPNSVAEAKPDFFGASNVGVNEVVQCPGSTTDMCIHLVVAGPAQVTHSGAVARFHFLANAGGNVCFSIFQSTLANADGFQVSHDRGADQCVFVPQKGSSKGVVLRQGTPANPNSGGGTLACSTVTARSSTGVTATATTDASGNFKFENITPDTYTFIASYPGYLNTEKANVAVPNSTTTVELGSTTLRGGDVNGDNFINILDVGTIISKFGKPATGVKSASANCSATDDPADINDDGLVNISDLAITAGNWSLKTGPTPWQ